MIIDTIQDIVFTMICSAFVGFVVGHFMEAGNNIGMFIMTSVIIGMIFLVVYYGYCAYKEWKVEKKKLHNRSGYTR